MSGAFSGVFQRWAFLCDSISDAAQVDWDQNGIKHQHCSLRGIPRKLQLRPPETQRTGGRRPRRSVTSTESSRAAPHPDLEPLCNGSSRHLRLFQWRQVWTAIPHQEPEVMVHGRLRLIHIVKETRKMILRLVWEFSVLPKGVILAKALTSGETGVEEAIWRSVTSSGGRETRGHSTQRLPRSPGLKPRVSVCYQRTI